MASATSRPPRRTASTAASFRLKSHIFYYFSQILARRNRALNLELRAFGLDYQRWRVMAVLNEETDCSMRRLSDLSSVDRTTLTRTLNLMQEEGLVTRRLRASDRRSVSVSLSPHGRQLLKQILPIVLGQSERALAGFTAREFDELRGQLTRIAENLKG